MTSMSKNFVGANAERARSHNRQVVLGRLRAEGQVGRAEIARGSGLSIQAVSNIIADLLEDGLILEQGRRAVGRGQPPVQYALNPDGRFALGVEIRPDAVFAALLNLCGDTLASERLALDATDRASLTTAVLRARDGVLARAGTEPRRLLGAGIVMPGPFGKTGLQGSGSELPVWDETTPEAWFADALGLPVVVENDANAAAIAERVNGVAQGLGSYAFLYFGRGLGLGIVQQGRLVRGAFGNAGEIGHIPVPSKVGVVPLESMVSRLSVQSLMGDAGIKISSGDDLSRLYAEGEPTLLRWLDTAVQPLSAAVTIIENMLDPETIILGGAMPDAILDHLVAAVELPDRSVAHREARARPRLMRGASGRMTATLGAAALILDEAFTPRIAAHPSDGP